MKRFAPVAALVTALSSVTAAGQDGAPIIVPSQSSVYNQTSVNLPTPPSVFGQDLVRAADGVSCQTSVASGGPYLDIGVTRSDDVFDRESRAVYGRVVMPLGPRPKRVDCTRLYELEITRMRMELELLRMGQATTALAPMPIAHQPAPVTAPEPVQPIARDPKPEAAIAPQEEVPARTVDRVYVAAPKTPPGPPTIKPETACDHDTLLAGIDDASASRRRRGLR